MTSTTEAPLPCTDAAGREKVFRGCCPAQAAVRITQGTQGQAEFCLAAGSYPARGRPTSPTPEDQPATPPHLGTAAPRSLTMALRSYSSEESSPSLIMARLSSLSGDRGRSLTMAPLLISLLLSPQVNTQANVLLSQHRSSASSLATGRTLPSYWRVC